MTFPRHSFLESSCESISEEVAQPSPYQQSLQHYQQVIADLDGPEERSRSSSPEEKPVASRANRSTATSNPYASTAFQSPYVSSTRMAHSRGHAPSRLYATEREGGLCGLSNLGMLAFLFFSFLILVGNTCFMNSTIQCLSNAVPFKDHFVNDAYKSEINKYG